MALELAGGVMGALATAKLLVQVVRVGSDYARTIRDWNDESRKLALRMSAQMTLSGHIQNVLVSRMVPLASTLPSSPRVPLIEEMSHEMRRDVCSIIREFHIIVTTRYQNLQTTHSLDVSLNREREASSAVLGQGRGSRPRLSWILWDKKKVKETICECEQWNERLFAIVQSYILSDLLLVNWNNPGRRIPSPDLWELKDDSDIKALGLNNDIEIAEMTANEFQDWGDLEVVGVSLDKKDMEQVRCGSFDGQRVVLDFKTFEPDPSNQGSKEPKPEVLNRIRQLVALLNRRHSSRARLLPCRGFYRPVETCAFGLVFDFPSGSFSNPVSLLYTLKQSKSNGEKPPLETRLRLAFTLAAALFDLHTLGWVHKSVRSGNILFFSESLDDPRPALRSPYLIGFEYSREDNGFSENPTTLDTTNDIYRHPHVWGNPTNRFNKIHDIYSLGIVLLEIGLWMPASDLEGSSFKMIDHTDRFDVQKIFITKAAQRLPFLLGSAYATVVRKCLTGQFDATQDGESPLTKEAYQYQIIDVLRSLCFHSEIEAS